MTADVERNGEVDTTVIEFWERPPDDYRAEVLESTGPESPGDVTVMNGETVWIYDSELDEVTVTDVPEVAPQEPMVDEAAAFELRLEPYDVTYGGTETVDGRETHVLELTPEDPDDDRAVYDEQTLWIDDEYWYPVKEETVLVEDGDRMTITITYDDLEFDQGLDDERFTFEPPEDADVVESELPDVQEYESIDEAAQAVPFDVGEPEVPEGYELQSVTVSDAPQATAASAVYERADADARLLFTATDQRPEYLEDADGESVAIGDREGTLVEQFGTTSVYWECDGVYYELSETGDLEAEALLEIAETVPCE